ncbi:MAG: hypothetical protein IID43_03000, partial [Planctomycetes bacterium]|nr:hypothetical protein [Planctomycetota bacterium]
MLRKHFAVLTVLLLTFCGPAHGAPGDVNRVLQMMPADLPVTFVVADMEALNKSFIALTKRLDPDSKESGPLAQIRKELKISRWIDELIDFSKPMAMAQEKLGGDPSLVCLCVPGFVKAMKERSGASEHDGVWELTTGSDPEGGQKGQTLYAFVKGDYVIAADTKAALERVRTLERSLADELKDRMETYGGRNILIHINIEPMRDKALAGIAQGAQMAPMIAMMAAAQGGVNPMFMTNMINGVFDASTKFVEQIAYVDISADISAKAIDATIATGYKPGSIKSYLAKQKPATMDFLTEIEDQPYFAAVGFHVPGDKSPFFDYVLDKLIGAVATAPASGGSGVGADGAGTEGKSATEGTPTTPEGEGGADATVV